jgi:DNA (cytosine-5)-methyltransferase 1
MVPTIDLFAGAGGLTLGLKRAGFQPVCAVEIEPSRVATFVRHTRGADVLVGDIRKIQFGHYRGKVDLVSGGPPCQPFSSGGLRRSLDDERNMIPHFVRTVRSVRPIAFLMENVPGLAAGDRRDYLKSVLMEFENAGYHISWRILNAADFGVPQKRRRLFVVGMRHRRFVFPQPTHGPGRKHPHVAVRDVLPSHQIGEPNSSRVFYAKCPDIRPSPFDGHIFNGGGRPIDRTQPCHTILASAGGNKTHFFDELGLVPAYHRRLMRGGKPKSGALPGTRRLTVLESAIIQTFPEDTVFVGTRSAQYRQVGDAVPPLLATAIGRAIASQLGDDDVEDPEIVGSLFAKAAAALPQA